MKETYTKDTGPSQPEPNKNVIVTDHHREPKLTPSPDRTPLWVAIGILAIVVVAGVFWVNKEDDKEDRVATTTTVTESIPVREVDPENQDAERATFVHSSTVEIRDLRSNAESLAQNVSSRDRNRIIDYQNRVDSLERALVESDNSAQVREDLESQLQAMRSEYTELQSELQVQTDATQVEAEQAMTTAKNAQEQASEAGQQNDLTAFAEQAETRLESLETQLVKFQSGPQSQNTNTTLSRLETEVQNVSNQVDEMQAASDTATRDRLRNAIDVNLGSLEEQMNGLEL